MKSLLNRRQFACLSLIGFALLIAAKATTAANSCYATISATATVAAPLGAMNAAELPSSTEVFITVTGNEGDQSSGIVALLPGNEECLMIVSNGTVSRTYALRNDDHDPRLESIPLSSGGVISGSPSVITLIPANI